MIDALSGNTGLHIARGTANIGTRWGHGARAEESATIFKAYPNAGGNFIDTAD